MATLWGRTQNVDSTSPLIALNFAVNRSSFHIEAISKQNKITAILYNNFYIVLIYES